MCWGVDDVVVFSSQAFGTGDFGCRIANSLPIPRM